MPEITIPYGAETEPDIPIRINGVDHSIRAGVQSTVTDAVFATLQQSFYADDIVVHEDEGGGGDFLDTQTVTSARTAGTAGVDTTGYSNGTLLIVGQGACADGTSWLGGQIEALACQDGNGFGKRVLVCAVLGAIPDAGWEKMTINGHEYLRADTIYDNFGGAAGIWQWAGPEAAGLTTDPFVDGGGNIVTWE